MSPAPLDAPRLIFLGTGPSGGTRGTGRARRREPLLVRDEAASLLLDVTRDFDEQARDHLRDAQLDAVLLTHAHRDASGGLPRLARWRAAHGRGPLTVLASAATIEAVTARHRRLAPLRFTPIAPGQARRLGPWTVKPLLVPHARDPRHPTYAWRLTRRRARIVYASDVARLEPALRSFARGATVLVIDGAMWGRPLYTHLRIDVVLPELCEWPVAQIVLTRIGKTAPPPDELERRVAQLCPRASPAHDGQEIDASR